MENYRRKIKKRGIICRVVILIAIAIFIFCNQVPFLQFNTSYYEDDYVQGFILGLLLAIELLSGIYLSKITKALKDEKQLRLMYNKENDERLKEIRSKAGMPYIAVVSVILIFIGIIVSRFSSIVFKTITAVVLFQLLGALIVKFYYRVRM